ncbi:MAG: hypothetical protein WCR72_14695 [Bacteroidota bacterium]
MKKLKFLAGGQPFRSTDFEVLQNANLTGVQQLFNGITSAVTILSGIAHDSFAGFDPATPFTVTAGYVYDLTEICRVPTASFTYDSSKSLYLRRAVVETSERMVGSSLQYVMTEVIYNLVYIATAALGDIPLSTLPRLTISTSDTLLLKQDTHDYALGTGFTSALAHGMYCFRNGFFDCMIVCQFNATSSSGTLCTLPANMRPAFDIVGFYKSGSTIVPLTIRTNGNVEISGASTSVTNLIVFRYSVGVTLSA